jgi:hypothetical protein
MGMDVEVDGRAVAPPAAQAPRAVPDAEDAAIAAAFGDAVAAAVAKAHASGLAVPARVDGALTEIRPDGTTARIAEPGHWTPTDWKSRPTG